MCVLILFLVASFFLIRIILVIAGFLKGPVLKASHRYGDQETFYEALPQFLFWLGAWTANASILVTAIIPSGFLVLQVFSFILFASALITRAYPNIGLRYFRYPRWYFELMEETTRYERRRIAYMWLNLPPRLRYIYNANNTAFRQWADMVILSTIF